MEQRAATTPLQRPRFWLVPFRSAHVVPAAFISASVLLSQFCFGRPTLRFPCFQAEEKIADQTRYLALSKRTDIGPVVGRTACRHAMQSAKNSLLSWTRRHQRPPPGLPCGEVSVSRAAYVGFTPRYRLVGLVVKASASRAEDPGLESRFSGSSHSGDLKIGTPVATLPGA